jgi:spoIIIJ-associated protein
MIKIEALTLEEAYSEAAVKLECSITQLKIEVVQVPSKGLLGLFKKPAIIVAAVDNSQQESKKEQPEKEQPKQAPQEDKKTTQNIYNDTILPESFVSTQEDEDYDEDYADDEIDEETYEEIINESLEDVQTMNISEIVVEVKEDINKLFENICFEIDDIDVSAYDENTILIEFSGTDAALLIGKEGYRYKALSYMIFNWINSKYQVGLRLEIAEFLKNQEESVMRYLESVHDNVDRDGRAQTKILDGVLVQIALKELRNSYPDKYVAIRTTRDGLKYIIINDYHNN